LLKIIVEETKRHLEKEDMRISGIRNSMGRVVRNLLLE